MGRRSRMRRESRGKRLVLTPRDLEIFRLLCRYRYLNSEYLHAFVGGQSEKRFKERLGDLFHEGYLDRPQRQWDFAVCHQGPVVYESGERSEQIGQRHFTNLAHPVTFLRAHQHRQFQHSTMICHVLAAVDLLTHRNPAIGFIGWNEILAKGPVSLQSASRPFAISVPIANSTEYGQIEKSLLVPDAIFGIRYNEVGSIKFRFFALEIDRATMPIVRSDPRGVSYLRKLLAYRRMIELRLYKSFWGLPNLMVLTISTNENHLQHVIDQATEISKAPSPFFFKALAEGNANDPGVAQCHLKFPWLG